MSADYNGRWEMIKNDNFEDVMKAIGKHIFSIIHLHSEKIIYTDQQRLAHKYTCYSVPRTHAVYITVFYTAVSYRLCNTEFMGVWWKICL